MALNSRNGRTPLKAAVIGAGMMGSHHVRIYSQLPSVEVVGVVEPLKARAEEMSIQFQVPVFSSIEVMLVQVRPDLASIVVPTRLHYPTASQLMKAGIDVLLEKPIAANLEEGRKLIELARQTQAVFGIGHIERFNPGVIALKMQLQDKALGKINRIHTRRKGLPPSRPPDSGVTIDLATHDLDLMLWLLGTLPLNVTGQLLYKTHTPFEDHVVANLQFPDGIEATLEADWLSPFKTRELTVIGEKGCFHLNYIAQELTFYRPGLLPGEEQSPTGSGERAERAVPLKPENLGTELPEPLRLELETFVTCCAARLPFPVSGEAGLKALYLAELLVQSGTSRQKLSADLSKLLCEEN